MEIVYISGAKLEARRAHVVHAMRMCEAMTEVGHHVRLLAIAGGGDAPADKLFAHYDIRQQFEIHRVRARQWPVIGSFFVAIALYRWLTRHAISSDLVYSRHIYGAYAAVRAGIPLVYESHGPPRNRVQRWVERRVISSGHLGRVVVISNALAAYYAAHYPDLGDGDVVVAHDAASGPRDGGGVGCTLPQRRSLESPSGGLSVGYTGGLHPGRGIQLLVELAMRLPHYEFHIAGSGPLQPWLEGAAADLPNVIVHGHLDQRALQRLRADCDVFVAPYESEVKTAGGFDSTKWMSPLKVFEYMAEGKPMVCSDLPVIHEVLTDSDDALLAPTGDVEAWEHALRSLEDMSARRRIGAAARDLWERKYTWTSRAKKVLSDGGGRRDER